MKNARAILVAAAMLAGPAAAGAQVTNHVSWQMGLAAGGYPSWTVPGIGLGYQPFGLSGGIGFGVGMSFSLGFGVHDNYWGGYGHGLLGRSHCRDAYLYDPFLYDPFLDCWGAGPFGYGPVAWDGWYNPWWRPFGFLGWPSRRYLAQHYYAWAPAWSYGWAPAWSYAWTPGWSRYPYGVYGGRYWGYDDWDRGRRYQSRRHYAHDGYAGRSPLFGPRYKEPPVYVTDNGPERPVATLRPRGPNGTLDDIDSRRGRSLDGASQLRGVRTARPRNQPGARTAIPRPSTRGTPSTTRRPSPIRGTPPKVRKRPETVTSDRPRRPAPRTRSVPSRRPQPAVRTPAPRRMPTTVRTSPPKRQPTTIRTAPRRPAIKSTAPRRSPPKVRSSAPRRSPPKARPAPRRSPPKARPAPKRSPPKARPAPKRPPSRAPAKRSAPPRRRGG